MFLITEGKVLGAFVHSPFPSAEPLHEGLTPPSRRGDTHHPLEGDRKRLFRSASVIPRRIALSSRHETTTVEPSGGISPTMKPPRGDGVIVIVHVTYPPHGVSRGRGISSITASVTSGIQGIRSTLRNLGRAPSGAIHEGTHPDVSLVGFATLSRRGGVSRREEHP